MSRSSAALFLALTLFTAAGCMTGRGRVQRASGEPTCKAVCDFYTACRGTDAPAVQEACESECQEIFYEDGKADARSLREFQQLECSEAVAFVEGESGRPPGITSKPTPKPNQHEAKR